MSEARDALAASVARAERLLAIYEKMNESERVGVQLGLFPTWVGELSHEDVVELMRIAS